MKGQTKNAKTKNTNTEKSVISPEIRAILKEYNEGMKQYVNALLKASSEDFQWHTSALSEDFQGKVAVVAEQVTGTNDKVDKQGEKLDEVIRIQHTHTNMIGAIMEDVSEIKIELKNKADKIEAVRLDRRVRVLEHVVR